jgi:hypothetical protein
MIRDHPRHPRKIPTLRLLAHSGMEYLAKLAA